jgi:plasmid stabilization system protein ParE
MDCAVIYSEAALADLEQMTKFIAADNAEVAERGCKSVGGLC